MGVITDVFGSNVFSDAVMKERLPKDTYEALKKTISEGKELDLNIANAVASAMMEWALEKGCTHYTHWFQPLTGITAEKHDSFLQITESGEAIEKFSGKSLIKGEPDASSFPSGGIRATFEARGYTAWDPTSFAFIKDDTLCIPTAFCSYTGEVLDKKTPLLRSMEAISVQAVKLLHLCGNEATRVITTAGPEQEYFIIKKETFEKRRDLVFTGRTLFGAKPPKGQELEDQYFATIRPEVKAFMSDLNRELWALGIYATTEHNETAPSQHELAPIFTNVNLSTDHNQLIMENMKKIALRHGLVCLLNEKPFAGVNGSGKHNNWSMATNLGENLLRPGKDPYHNTQFLLFLSAAIRAVDEYQDLLRISAASAMNDNRLGGNEAPPAIVSMYLGDDLTAVLDAIVTGKKFSDLARPKMQTGVSAIPEFSKDTTDRNRTSPFAFTGNKFEFRMVGSSQSIADPNIVLNTIMAEVISDFVKKLENKPDFERAARALIRKTVKEHARIIFNGNGYAPEWVEEAKRRGLSNLKTTPDAVAHLCDEKNLKVFAKHKVYTEVELKSLAEVMLEEYAQIKQIEVRTMLGMAKTQILPACLAYEKELSELISYKKSSGIGDPSTEADLLSRIEALTNEFYNAINALEKAQEGILPIKDTTAEANYIRDAILPAMDAVRAPADKLERLVAKKYWPFPTYGDILFY